MKVYTPTTKANKVRGLIRHLKTQRSDRQAATILYDLDAGKGNAFLQALGYRMNEGNMSLLPDHNDVYAGDFL